LTLYIGTAGWSYPSGAGRWDGVFYPDALPDRDKLSFYARFFDAVEINSSFYRPPLAGVTRGWAARVPATFRFTAKLWQKFTHPRMFAEATGAPTALEDRDFEEFARGIRPLAEAEKLGALLAQFPPSFKADDGAADYVADLVGRFTREGFPLAVELRHRSWTEPGDAARAVRALFEEAGVAWTMIDEPKFSSSIRNVPLTSRLGYFRFHGRNYQQWWHPEAAEDRYNYLYSAEEQRALAASVREVADRAQDVFAFYNNHYRAKAVVNALELQATLGEPLRATPPEALVVEYPELRQLATPEARPLSGAETPPRVPQRG